MERCEFYEFPTGEDGAVLAIRCKDEAKEEVGGYSYCKRHAQMTKDAQERRRQKDPDRKPASHNPSD
jgi:hypothetical protein